VVSKLGVTFDISQLRQGMTETGCRGLVGAQCPGYLGEGQRTGRCSEGLEDLQSPGERGDEIVRVLCSFSHAAHQLLRIVQHNYIYCNFCYHCMVRMSSPIFGMLIIFLMDTHQAGFLRNGCPGDVISG